ncbi:MAG TPA: glycine-rich protein, partial [Candidatus Cybelea sp.]|nr:glycine-rich protein [Candidatus Cybelea sp.]
MRISGSGRYALSCCLAAAMLAGCGGHANDGVMPIGAASGGASSYYKFPYHKSFYYTGREQEFKVPASVRHIKVIALGAHGAGIPEVRGGRVSAILPVAPGQELLVVVGGNAAGANGGFNGGADGGQGYQGGHPGYGGGGASDVRQRGGQLSDRIVVSGGGGGQGGGQGRYASGGVGGKGGGLTGGTGGTGGTY